MQWPIFLRLCLLVAVTITIDIPAVLGQVRDSIVLPAVVIEAPADTLQKYLFRNIQPNTMVVSGLITLPGVQIQDYGGHGGVKTVSVRGFNSNLTEVQIESVPFESPLTGSINFSGWHTGAFGNITLTAAQFYAPTLNFNLTTDSLRYRFTVQAGSFHEKKASAYYKHTRKLDVLIDGQLLHTKDNFPYQINAESGLRQNADFQSIQLTGSLKKQWHRHRFSYFNFSQLIDQSVPGPVLTGNPVTLPESLKRQQLFHYFKWQTGDCFGGQLESWCKHQREKSNYRTRNQLFDYQLDNLRTHLQYTRRTVDMQVQTAYTIVSGDNLAVSWQRIDATVRKEITALLTWNQPINKRYFISGGVKWAAIDSFKPMYHFRTAITFIPNRFLQFTFNTYRSYRVPAINELYFYGFGNPNLQPEQTQQIECSAAKRLQWLGFQLVSKLTFFYQRVNQKIVSIPQTPVRWTTLSLGYTTGKGIEYVFSAYHTQYFSIQGHVSWQQIIDQTLNRGARVPYIPALSGHLHIRKNWKSYEAALQTQYNSYRFTSLQNDALNTLPGIALIHLVLQKKWAYKNVSIHSGIEIRNITNLNYAMLPSYPMPGRSFHIFIHFSH